VIANAIPVRLEEIELVSVAEDRKKVFEIVKQTSLKRLNKSVYKDLVKENK